MHFDESKWESACWRYIACSHKSRLFDSGLDAISFWDNLADRTKGSETWWVIGWNIYELLCRYEMYQRIVDGKIKITKNSSVHFPDGIKSTKSALFGALICENPPTIIDCELEGGGRVKFLDPRNYGLQREMFDDDGDSSGINGVVQCVEDYVCLLRTLDMGSLKTTAASQGWYAFRRGHLKTDLVADDSDAARRVERASYYAGRCEAFRLGRIVDGCAHLDVSAMYTSFGFTQRFPTKLLAIHSMPHKDKLFNVKHGRHFIADVTVKTDVPRFPLRCCGKVIYPIGTFRTSLAWPELHLALWAGCVQSVHVACEYETAPIFEHWSSWYKHALDSLVDLGLDHLRPALKLCVNSMYGKIGQRSKDWTDRPSDKPCFPFDQWWQRHPIHRNVVQWRAISGHTQYLDAGGESPISLPSISATMCSYGRLHIWRLMQMARQENTFYVDTDGIMVNDAGYESLHNGGEIQPGTIGKLRIRELDSDVELFGIKHYRFGQRYVCAGVPLQGMERYRGGVAFNRHTPFNFSLWHKTAFVHKFDRITRSESVKYKHGVVQPDGLVRPFVVGDIRGTIEGTDNGRSSDPTYGIMGSTNPSPWV